MDVQVWQLSDQLLCHALSLWRAKSRGEVLPWRESSRVSVKQKRHGQLSSVFCFTGGAQIMSFQTLLNMLIRPAYLPFFYYFSDLKRKKHLVWRTTNKLRLPNQTVREFPVL
jgi:hypothetical protein